jgi:hypothetical protein
MPQENVELVRRILARFGQTLQPVTDLTSPDFIWHTGSWTLWTGPSEYRGTDGFMQFFREWIAAYDEWNRTRKRSSTRETTKSSQPPVNEAACTTATRGSIWRRVLFTPSTTGLLVRADVYGGRRAEALKTAGLAE